VLTLFLLCLGAIFYVAGGIFTVHELSATVADSIVAQIVVFLFWPVLMVLSIFMGAFSIISGE
jgi:hypothetical protein